MNYLRHRVSITDCTLATDTEQIIADWSGWNVNVAVGYVRLIICHVRPCHFLCVMLSPAPCESIQCLSILQWIKYSSKNRCFAAASQVHGCQQ